MHLALLGTLSLLQVTFLPGYLLLRGLRPGGGAIATAVLSFALSLLVNFAMVALLTAAGLYRPMVVYAIFAAEMALWLRLDAWRLGGRLGDTFAGVRSRTKSFFTDFEQNCPIRSPWLRRPLIAAAVALIVVFALAGVADIGRIFEQWDAVVSWNRWAIDWASNRFPEVTSYYPQLLPANVSLTYVFMQTSDIWIFAKGVQFLFCLLLLLAMLDAARQPGNFGLVSGAVITYALLVALLRYRMLSSGYADVPLAFFAWTPLYALTLAGRAAERGQRQRCLVLGALLAAAAALTKQPGLYVAAVYPLLAWLHAARAVAAGVSIRVYVRLYLLLAALVAPWYVYKAIDILADHDANNTSQLLSDYHEGRGLAQRMAHSAAAVAEATTLPGGALLLIALAASLGERRSRQLLGLFVAPLGLLWAAGFSYDLRNLAMLAPFLGTAAGFGVVRIVHWAERGPLRARVAFRSAKAALLSRSERRLSGRARGFRLGSMLRVWHVVVPLSVLAITATFFVRDDLLRSMQNRQQRRVGILSLNEQLYAFAAAHPETDLISTDYLAMKWLPDLAPRSVVCMCHKLAAFRRTFDLPNVRYVLVRSAGEAADVRAFLARGAGVRLLFEDHGFAFYEKLAPSR